MPELPEVEVIRKQLTPLIVGKTISSIEVLLKKSFIGETQDLIGKKIIKLDRKGKVLILSFRSVASVIASPVAGRGDLVSSAADCHGETPRNDRDSLYIHLRMSGQLQFLPHEETPRPARSLLSNPQHKHLRVIIHFIDRSQLQFIDQRTFGFITTNSNIIPKGIDALAPALTAGKLSTILKSASRPIKQILLDQNLIAGIGNIYASEILWEAKINPASKGLTSRRGQTLLEAIRKILTEAIKYGGSTISDQLYRHVGGQAGGYQKRFKVYDRAGQPCLRCQTSIQKIKLGQRSTYFCPKCQKGGLVR